jgi:hypothetical protein
LSRHKLQLARNNSHAKHQMSQITLNKSRVRPATPASRRTLKEPLCSLQWTQTAQRRTKMSVPVGGTGQGSYSRVRVMPEHAVTCSSVASMSANEGPGASSAAAAAAAAMGKFESVSCAGLGAGGDAVGESSVGESSCLSDPANVAK